VKHSTALSLEADEWATRRILVVDRNAASRRTIRVALESRLRNVVVDECENDTVAAGMIECEAVDVVLLDATSSAWSALSDARGSPVSPSPILVVITSREQLANAVNDFSAADYVVRPFSSDRLSLAIHRAFSRLDERNVGSRSEIAALPARGHTYRRRFLVTIGTRDVVVHADDLAWVRANGYCATLVSRDRKEYLVRLPLDQLEAELDPDEFIRIHRSAIVRLRELLELERSASRSLLAVLRSGARIPVSRSRRDALMRALGGA
jgi:two-component system LytT family response regulator